MRVFADFQTLSFLLERFAGWREGEDSTPFRSASRKLPLDAKLLRVASQVIGMTPPASIFLRKCNRTLPEGRKDRVVELVG